MKTFLAQNQFNTTAPQPPAVESDGVGAKPILASSPSEAVTVSVRAPVAADLCAGGVSPGWDECEKCGATMDEECKFADSSGQTPAARSEQRGPPRRSDAAGSGGPQPTNHIRADLSDWDINGSENIHEIFAYARKLCREQSPDIENHRFAPNYSGMFHAATGEDVWSDPPPMFLQSVR